MDISKEKLLETLDDIRNANAPAASGAPGQDATPNDNFTGFQNFGGNGGMFDEN